MAVTVRPPRLAVFLHTTQVVAEEDLALPQYYPVLAVKVAEVQVAPA
jgi:hypothetical protein